MGVNNAKIIAGMIREKLIIYCGKGILERIEEEDSFKNTIKPYTKEDLINHLKEMFEVVPEPKKEIIVIGNGLTDEQINKIINFKTN